MRSLIVLVLAFALALADDSLIRKRRAAGGHGGYGFSYATARIEAHEMRLHHLSDEIHNLESHIDDDDHVPEAMDVLEHRMDNIEGDACQHRTYSCGRHSGQCVAKLEFCDGVDDCDNHEDESHAKCDNPVPAGRSWTGHAHWNSCLVRSENVMTVLITGNKRMEHFQSVLWIDAMVIEHYSKQGEKHEETWSAHGHFNYADRSFVLNPPEGSTARIGMECHDAGGHSAYCEFIRESDHHVCGSATLHRGGEPENHSDDDEEHH